MKNIVLLIVIILLSFQNFVSCGFNSKNQEKLSQIATTDSTYFILVDTLIKKIKVRVVISSDGVLINLNDKKNNLLWEEKRDLPKEILTGLFFIDNKKIAKQAFFFKNNLLLFTIFDELYRGELFILNLENGLLVKNKTSKTTFLNSDVGPFIIDKKTNRIITASKTLVTDDGEIIINRKIAIYSFNEEEINYEGGFEITKIDELNDDDYISIFDKYKNGFIKK